MKLNTLVPARSIGLCEIAEAAAKAAAGKHAQMREEEARLHAAIAWARFAQSSYLAVMESAQNSAKARAFVEPARKHQVRAELHLRLRLAAFIASSSRFSQL